MTNLLVLCGASGSGKSTLSKEIAEKQNLIRLSMDELNFFSHSELLPLITELLESNKDIIIDALYTKLKWRKEILEATNRFDCKRTLIYMNTSLNECIRRNKGRKSPLPDLVIEHTYNKIESPSLDEGWDEILYY